ncbi:hypothetical protein JAAARDRAFT_61652 [Jaapia argillacea MUCL 33604]|uniref:Uncharacterized protein n=1 Tax=Jaapia argillacea MUCL 33604 TaxID=933084 RepID=A0A067PRD3_9AGAM|nr:hypothetical protein JAAARDRAFT_61652 [Jaapia argillacea MUCL 33604]
MDPNDVIVYPEERKALQTQLLGGYKPSVIPPGDFSPPRTLTASELASLKHYLVWQKTNGTVKAYNGHADNLRDENIEILSLYSVHKLAIELTDLRPAQVDICPWNCLAYTGEYENLQFCLYIHDKKPCGLACYCPKQSPSDKNQPQAQMTYMQIMAIIRGLYANIESSVLMRRWDQLLQQALKLVAEAKERKYSDFGDSNVHLHHYNDMKLFQEKRDIAFALLTDGAQLTMKKESDTWVLILIILNLPPEIQYKTSNTIIPLAIPGPYSPENIESFLLVKVSGCGMLLTLHTFCVELIFVWLLEICLDLQN